MLSKCANPDCSEQFHSITQGKLFHLTPTRELEILSEDYFPFLYERYWLCDRCSKEMTVIWDGTQARVVTLPASQIDLQGNPTKPTSLDDPVRGLGEVSVMPKSRG